MPQALVPNSPSCELVSDQPRCKKMYHRLSLGKDAAGTLLPRDHSEPRDETALSL